MPVVHGAHDGNPEDARLRCTVHVGFRLNPGQDPGLAKLGGWPAIANWAQINLRAAIVFADGSQGPEIDVPKTDLSVWQAFLPLDTPVVAYPDPAQMPSLDGPVVWFDAHRVADVVRQRFGQIGRTSFGRGGGSPLPLPPVMAPSAGLGHTGIIGQSPPPEDLLSQVRSFFQARPSPHGPSIMVITPRPDIHDIIATLHGVPGALAALRLAFPLTAPWPVSIAKPSAVRVKVTTDTPATIICPWFAVSKTAIADGFVPPNSWAALPFDTTGAAHALAFGGDNASLRSAGFALARLPQNGRSAQLAAIRQRFTRVQGLGNASSAPYGIDDVTRGVRVDVWDQTRGRWFSLCRISGKASCGGKAITFEDAEGMVSDALCHDPDATLRANDTIGQWLGWSICAASPAAQPAPPDGAMNLERTVTPGTLPVLRFGRQYRFRLRKVDVNGDGLTLTSVSDFTGATEVVPFLRMEPVAPGPVAFGTTATPGESPTQLVVRSGPSITAPQHSVRYVLPPDIGIELAVMHGVFDGPNGVPDKTASGRFRSGTAWSGTPPSGPYPQKADLFAANTFASKPTIPYLPDPAANAAVLRPLDNGSVIGLGGDDPRLVAPFVGPKGAYPEGWAAAEIHLTPTTGPGAATIDGSAIRISLSPGKRMSFALTTAISPARLAEMAVFNWAAHGLPPTDAAVHSGFAAAGGILVLSPPRVITLVHAVQQPLAAPTFVGAPAVGARAVGATTIDISGTVSVHPETTLSVAIAAQWSEWSEELGQFVPRSQRLGEPHKVVAGSTVPFAETLQLRTTAHVDLTLTPLATGASVEMFPPGTDCTRSGTSVTLGVPSSQAPPTPRVAYAIPTFAWSEVRQTPTHVVRKRGGNALRLWLERPWFGSGAGEKLAVLVAASPGDETSRVSRWGIDPATHISATQASGRTFGSGDFIDAAAPRVEWPGDGPRPAVRLALHEVQLDAASGRYWCDVVFNASQIGGAYRPFVQLVVAAYQAQAIGAAQQLSEFVTVPMTQVFSDRELQVSLDGQGQPGISVKFAGPFISVPPEDITRGLYTRADLAMAFDGHSVQVLDEPGDDAGGSGKGGHGHVHPPAAAQIQIDARKPPTSDPEFGRNQDGDLTFSVDPGNYVPSLKAGWKTFSVTVQEFEMASFFTYDYTLYKVGAEITSDPPPGGAPFAVFPSSPYPRTMRLVYEDTVVITKE
jgi:hypothetical protein